MSIGERDPHSGHVTTGHEWNGITELNRPVPRLVWLFLVATVIFSVVYWVLMPAWPLGVTYTRGLLGIDQRTTVAESLAQGAAARSVWTVRAETEPLDDLLADETFLGHARTVGRTLFRDNCSVCHGAEGRGGRGFPSLADGSWTWGDDPETIAEILRVGINASHPETLFAEMPAFGRDGILDRRSILDVASYVLALSGAEGAGSPDDPAVAPGAQVFAMQCSACHGDRGEGVPDFGAPSLADGTWLYGGDRQAIYTSVFHGRAGYMPAWEGRLSLAERRLLTAYVLQIGSAGRD